MTVYALGDRVPEIHPDAYVHPDAVVIGSVYLAAFASIWPGAVLRGDFGDILIGENTSIQDGAVIHATEREPTEIGSGCTILHNAHLEGCRIGNDTLIGAMATVLNRSVVGDNCQVAPATLVKTDSIVPSRALASGVPATITEDAVGIGKNKVAADKYVVNGPRFKAELRRLD